MKKIIIILLLAMTTALNAQDFEGTLTYAVDFTLAQHMLDMGITKEMFKAKMKSDPNWADTIEISYKGGFYRQLFLSVDSTYMIYRPDSNQLYSFQKGEDFDLWTVTDPAVDLEHKMTGKMPSVTLLDTLIEDGEYSLKMVEVKWATGTYYYLFDENHFQTNPENFKGHIYDGWYAFLKLSKALPIKIIKDVGGMIATISLTDYSNKKIEDSFFQVPELVEDEDSFNIGASKLMKVKE